MSLLLERGLLFIYLQLVGWHVGHQEKDNSFSIREKRGEKELRR
jgi:hypothetical protein